MNDAQYTRYKNAKNTRLTCLLDKKDSFGNRHFLIQSTTDRYKVSIYKKTGQTICSCPDFKTRSVSDEIVCKHVLFVLMTYLNIITGINHSYFTRGSSTGRKPFLTPDECQKL